MMTAERIAAVAGFLCILYGTAMLSPAWAFIVCGIILLAAALPQKGPIR